MDVTLVKVDAKGLRRVWRVVVTHRDDGVSVNRYVYGVEGGAMQEKSLEYAKGKVKTRSAADQALLEARSKMTVKQREGYYVVEEGAGTEGGGGGGACGDGDGGDERGDSGEGSGPGSFESPLPMLAQEFDKRKQSVETKAVFIQPKLDGVRAVAHSRTGVLWSRNRVQFTAPAHISAELQALFATLRADTGSDSPFCDGDVWLDGELYTHGKSFNEVSSLVRQKTVKDRALLSTLQYHVYDVFLAAPYAVRLQALERIRAALRPGSSIVVVDTLRAAPPNVLAAVMDAHGVFTAQGYEGAMVRLDSPTPYQEGKRSPELLKVKTFMQEDFVLEKLMPETGAEHLVGVVLVKDPVKPEVRFGARPAMTKAEREHLWDVAHPGDIVTVKFFDYTPDGVPRFPVALGIRADGEPAM